MRESFLSSRLILNYINNETKRYNFYRLFTFLLHLFEFDERDIFTGSLD